MPLHRGAHSLCQNIRQLIVCSRVLYQKKSDPNSFAQTITPNRLCAFLRRVLSLGFVHCWSFGSLPHSLRICRERARALGNVGRNMVNELKCKDLSSRDSTLLGPQQGREIHKPRVREKKCECDGLTLSRLWRSRFPLADLPDNVSNPHSHNCRAGKPSIHKPASSEIISDPALLWETAVCFLHIHEIGLNVRGPKYAQQPPDVDSESRISPANEASSIDQICDFQFDVPHDRVACSSWFLNDVIYQS